MIRNLIVKWPLTYQSLFMLENISSYADLDFSEGYIIKTKRIPPLTVW